MDHQAFFSKLNEVNDTISHALATCMAMEEAGKTVDPKQYAFLSRQIFGALADGLDEATDDLADLLNGFEDAYLSGGGNP